MLVVQFELWFSLLVSKCLYVLCLVVDGLRLSGVVVYCSSVLVLTSPPKVLGLCFGANFEINWAGGGGRGKHLLADVVQLDGRGYGTFL